jgi:hypothetical protein
MKPEVLLVINVSVDEKARLDPELLRISTHVRESERGEKIFWVLGPDAWHLAPGIRARLEGFPTDSWYADPRIIEHDDPWDASLVYVRPDRLRGGQNP